jgi:hypothetical protein
MCRDKRPWVAGVHLGEILAYHAQLGGIEGCDWLNLRSNVCFGLSLSRRDILLLVIPPDRFIVTPT